MEKTIQNIVIEFAQAIETSIGTEETSTLLTNLTTFAKTCPETVIELKELVENNPSIFASLLTPDGVAEAKQLIEQVAVYAPMMGMFK